MPYLPGHQGRHAGAMTDPLAQETQDALVGWVHWTVWAVPTLGRYLGTTGCGIQVALGGPETRSGSGRGVNCAACLAYVLDHHGAVVRDQARGPQDV